MSTLVLDLCARRVLVVAISSAVNSGHYSMAFDEHFAHHNILALDAEHAEVWMCGENVESLILSKRLYLKCIINEHVYN